MIPANNARSRLLRLSEAVEKLRRQAAVSVQTGKENDARELLFQKKKVMQAMENLKSRIELFDELSAKLNEVDPVFIYVTIGPFSIVKTIAFLHERISGDSFMTFAVMRKCELCQQCILSSTSAGMDLDLISDYNCNHLVWK